MNTNKTLVHATGGRGGGRAGGSTKPKLLRQMLSVARPLKGIQRANSNILNMFDVIDLNNNIMHLVRAHSEHFATASDIAGHLHSDFSIAAQLMLVARITRLAFRFFKNKALTTSQTHAMAAASLMMMYVMYADVF